jgi:hypothetical protein
MMSLGGKGADQHRSECGAQRNGQLGQFVSAQAVGQSCEIAIETIAVDSRPVH